MLSMVYFTSLLNGMHVAKQILIRIQLRIRICATNRYSRELIQNVQAWECCVLSTAIKPTRM